MLHANDHRTDTATTASQKEKKYLLFKNMWRILKIKETRFRQQFLTPCYILVLKSYYTFEKIKIFWNVLALILQSQKTENRVKNIFQNQIIVNYIQTIINNLKISKFKKKKTSNIAILLK